MTTAADPLRPVKPAFLRLVAADLTGQAIALDSLYADAALKGMRLGDARATAIPPAEPSGTFGGLTRPTGLAVGPQGRLLLSDPEHNVILGYTTYSGGFQPLWPARDSDPPDAYSLRAPLGLVFNRQGDLLVADSGHERVLVYTWPHLGLRRVLALPGAAPADLDFDPLGRLYVAAPGLGRVLRFDRLLNPDDSYLGGSGTLLTPRHLAFDSTGQLFVVDEGARQVLTLDEQGRASPVDLDDLYARSFTPAIRPQEGALWLPQEVRPNCPALRLDGLQLDRRGRLPGTNLAVMAVPNSVRYPRFGSLISAPLDSGIFNCSWHRLVFDLSLPDNCGMRVRSFTDAAPLDAARVLGLPAERWSQPLLVMPGDPPEVLVQSPPGQFLWLWLEFFGNGEGTPVLRAITVYAPRQSSLDYLPPIFREDPVSASFLERYLSYFDTVFAEIETQIEDFTGYIDPDGVPPGPFLDWLGAWFDLRFLPTWSESTRRRFIKEAMQLYRQRGTPAGLQKLLRLHTGVQEPYPVVIEHFRLNRIPVEQTLYLGGQPFTWDRAHEVTHHFTLIFPRQVAPDEQSLEGLLRFIQAQKPAHTHLRLLFVEPGMRIGCQSTIGVDFILGGWKPAALEGLALDQGLILSTSETDSRPRLGSFVLRSAGGFTCNPSV